MTSALASSSWDKTVRVWDVFGRSQKSETLTHSKDVLCLAFRPDGREICTATLAGDLVVREREERERLRERKRKREREREIVSLFTYQSLIPFFSQFLFLLLSFSSFSLFLSFSFGMST